MGEVGNNVNLDPYTYLCCGGTWNDKSILEWQESLELLSGEELTQDQKRVKEIGDSDVSQFTQFLGRVTQRRLKILAQLRSDNTTGQSPNGQDGAWTPTHPHTHTPTHPHTHTPTHPHTHTPTHPHTHTPTHPHTHTPTHPHTHTPTHPHTHTPTHPHNPFFFFFFFFFFFDCQG